jgi:sulfur transfer complex TusBCD TusB component (DsrH family)
MYITADYGLLSLVAAGIIGILGAFEDGQAFLAGVLAKIPDEGQRAQVKAAFESTAAKDAVTLLGDGVLARADYSKHMDTITRQDTELKEKLAAATDLYERNDRWYKTNEAALKEYPTLKTEVERLKAGGGGDGDGDGDDKGRKPQVDVKKTIEETIDSLLDSRLSDRERGYVDVVAFMSDLAFRHHTMFNEPLNQRELTSNPKLGRPIVGQPGRVFSLQDAYNEKYGERVLAKEKEAHDKQIETEVQKRLQEERAKNAGMPFPLRGDTTPSVLDVLSTEKGAAAHTLDTAVAAYEQLQAGRGLGGT